MLHDTQRELRLGEGMNTHSTRLRQSLIFDTTDCVASVRFLKYFTQSGTASVLILISYRTNDFLAKDEDEMRERVRD
ncbi:hypothetical protein VTL71DRAFT_8132 [Oculimacula yallundae]|uniref:Uncharacterized protein n=1 Tax=Oculimacula yallundae TaxID=86028 RepID=A0ABR4CWQ8_9HELO